MLPEPRAPECFYEADCLAEITVCPRQSLAGIPRQLASGFAQALLNSCNCYCTM